jgi:peptidyl-prolyl cis-trans isomerase C
LTHRALADYPRRPTLEFLMIRALRALPVLLALTGCPQEQAPPTPGEIPAGGETVVTVNGNPVTQEMIDATLKQLPDQLREQLEMTGQISQVQEQVVVGELLYREAIKQNLHTDKELALSLALAERNTLADAMLDKIVKDRTTDERVQKKYDEQAVRYARPQANIRVIVLESAELGAEVKGLLDGGADFAKLATERSKDPRTAPKGGEVGWVEKASMGPMGEQVFAGEKGGVVGPIDTPQGSLIFKIEDKREKTPLEDVREEIETGLKQEIAQEYIEEVKGAATITEAGATGATVTPPAPGAAGDAANAEAGKADAGKAGK